MARWGAAAAATAADAESKAYWGPTAMLAWATPSTRLCIPPFSPMFAAAADDALSCAPAMLVYRVLTWSCSDCKCWEIWRYSLWIVVSTWPCWQQGTFATHVLGVLEAAAAAIGRVHAVERQVAAPLARRLAIALDLAALAFVAVVRPQHQLAPRAPFFFPWGTTYHAMEMYRLRFALCCGPSLSCFRFAGDGRPSPAPPPGDSALPSMPVPSRPVPSRSSPPSPAS